MPRSKAEPRAEDVALRALRAADRSRSELDARLEQRGFADQERRQALDELERLGYLDDGSSPRSAAPSLTAAQSMPFAKADFTIDAVPTSAEIDRTLVKLETLAKERGLAVGVASALPISIERLAAWIKTLDSRGIMLVPLTTAMLKSKSG